MSVISEASVGDDACEFFPNTSPSVLNSRAKVYKIVTYRNNNLVITWIKK